METNLTLKNIDFVPWLSRAVKTVGFLGVVIAVVAVCDARLDGLRNAQNFMPAGYKTAAEQTKQLECLTRNIYWEAASEPFEGKVAVAQVTLNRMASGKFPDSVCGVVHQKNVFYERVVCQFSWYCDKTITSKRLTIKHTPLYNDILEMSTNLYLNFERTKDVTNGATYYHADYVNPEWSKLKKEKQIGRHIFYKSKGDKIDRNKGII